MRTKIRNTMYLFVAVLVIGTVLTNFGEWEDDSDSYGELRWDERLITVHFTAKGSGNGKPSTFDISGNIGTNEVDVDDALDGHTVTGVARVGDPVRLWAWALNGPFNQFFCIIKSNLKDITDHNNSSQTTSNRRNHIWCSAIVPR